MRLISMVVVLGGCAELGETGTSPLSHSQIPTVEAPTDAAACDSAHAESVYAELEAASGGNIAFSITAQECGAAGDVAGADLQDLLRDPAGQVELSLQGREVTGLNWQAGIQGEWGSPIAVQDFELAGLDVGTLRWTVVEVEVHTLAGAEGALAVEQVDAYEALQACFDQGCVLVDPAVPEAQSIFEFLQSEQGYTEDLSDSVPVVDWSTEGPPPAAKCQTSAGKTTVGASTSASTYYAKSFIGLTVTEVYLGATSYSVSCVASGSSCTASGASSASASSCTPKWGYTCDCDYGEDNATSSGTGTAWAEARCGWKSSGAAVSVSWSWRGTSISVSWAVTSSGTRTAGGKTTQTCAWY